MAFFQTLHRTLHRKASLEAGRTKEAAEKGRGLAGLLMDTDGPRATGAGDAGWKGMGPGS